MEYGRARIRPQQRGTLVLLRADMRPLIPLSPTHMHTRTHVDHTGVRTWRAGVPEPQAAAAARPHGRHGQDGDGARHAGRLGRPRAAHAHQGRSVCRTCYAGLECLRGPTRNKGRMGACDSQVGGAMHGSVGVPQTCRTHRAFRSRRAWRPTTARPPQRPRRFGPGHRQHAPSPNR
jgi:hypothetical protein